MRCISGGRMRRIDMMRFFCTGMTVRIVVHSLRRERG
jgi:hypothetical protein